MARRHSHIVELSAFAAKSLGLTQKDGFGFALKHQKGVYVEKYLDPKNCKGMGILPSDISKIPDSLKIAIKRNRDFSSGGKYPETEEISGCFISHGRTATCDRTISNTHPFQGIDNEGGLWTIAHNGVVDLIGQKIETKSTCDSEHILNCFTKLNGVHSLKSQVSGYAAILGINPKGEMVAFRDNTAPLYVSMIEEAGVFTLSTDPLHCEEFNEIVCKHNRIKKSKVTDSYLIEPYNFLTFHENGEITSVEFDAFSRYSSNYSGVRTSMGSAGVDDPYGSRSWGSHGTYKSSKSWGKTDYEVQRDLENDPDYLEYHDLPETKQPVLPGLSETERLLDDPAILEAVQNGQMSIRDAADICGEMDCSEEALEHLENKITNKLKKIGRVKPPRSLGDEVNPS